MPFFAKTYPGSGRPTGQIYEDTEPKQFSNDPELLNASSFSEAELELEKLIYQDKNDFLQWKDKDHYT